MSPRFISGYKHANSERVEVEKACESSAKLESGQTESLLLKKRSLAIEPSVSVILIPKN